jgi:hypothetical protein
MDQTRETSLRKAATVGGSTVAAGLCAARATIVLVLSALAMGGCGFVATRESHTTSRSKLPPGTQVFGEPNHNHVTGTVRYNRTPPAGGPHNDVWLNCGVYTRPVRNENAVHSLEHGAVWITYAPNLPPAGVTRLRRFVQGHYVGSQRYLILSPYPGLTAPVVSSAWGAQLRLRGPSDPRLAAFVSHFAGGDQGGEQGGPCTGGTGSPRD